MNVNETEHSPEKVLYHYTDLGNFSSIKNDGALKPHSGAYLSVNANGNFDFSYSIGPRDKDWISGRSKTPNIFLTDVEPENVDDEDFGISDDKKQAAVTIRISEILEQGFSVYENPCGEYENIFNVPAPNNRRLEVNTEDYVIL